MTRRFRIALGSDHAGFTYKEAIEAMLLAEPATPFTTSVPILTSHATTRTSSVPSRWRSPPGEFDRGIVLGGSGNGEAIVANRVRGVRCGLCWNEQVAIWNRSHNDANALSLGQRTISEAEALAIVTVWLDTEFEGGRHVARVRKIDEV